jgi:hypothetical protein
VDSSPGAHAPAGASKSRKPGRAARLSDLLVYFTHSWREGEGETTLFGEAYGAHALW